MRNHLILAVILAAGSASAQAGIVTYAGHDDGAPVAGPAPNSQAARSAFLAAAAPFPLIEDFEHSPPGYYNYLTVNFATITTASANFGVCDSGVTHGCHGSDWGFNSTPGGSQFFGFPGFNGVSATIAFDIPIKAFGFYTNGIQSDYSSAYSITENDGSGATLGIPINGTHGGWNFFGFTDTTAFTSVTIANFSAGDAWGIDDLVYSPALSGAVPEPANWAMMIAGFGLTGFAMRRRRISAIA